MRIQNSMKSSARLLISNHVISTTTFSQLADRVHKYRLRQFHQVHEEVMEVSVKPHPGRTEQMKIIGQQMGHGMPNTGSESWNINPGCLFSNRGCLLFSKRVARGRFVVCSLSPHV